MVKVSQRQAKRFLETINKKDKVIIFCHTDLDGFASGVLFYDFCLSKKCTNIRVHPITYGINKISDFDLKETTKVLIADLAPRIVSEDLFKLQDKKIFYTDHHPEDKNFPIPEKIFELRIIKKGYIPSSRTVYDLCGGKKWLSIAGVLSDFGDKYEINKEFIESFIRESGKSLEELKRSIIFTISMAIIYFENHSETNFFDILKEIKCIEDVNPILDKFEKPVKEELNKFIKDFEKNSEELKKINFYYFSSEYNIKSFIINFLSSRIPKKIYIFAAPKNEKLIGLSARNQSQEYNVSKILQDCVVDLKEGLAGGHKTAAGGQFAKQELGKFKQNLKNYDMEKARVKDEN